MEAEAAAVLHMLRKPALAVMAVILVAVVEVAGRR